VREHELKTWPEPFRALLEGRKHHEVRFNDREFAVGDVLVLQEWSPEKGRYTGRELRRVVSYMTGGGHFGLPLDLCVMSLELEP
jgi:hypothetical protein